MNSYYEQVFSFLLRPPDEVLGVKYVSIEEPESSAGTMSRVIKG